MSMDWIVTTGSTVDAALEAALDGLSVPLEDVEFEVITEPKSSVLGFRRKRAQVRVRIRPITPPAKRDWRRPERSRKPKGTKSRGRKGQTKASGTSRKRRTSTADKKPSPRSAETPAKPAANSSDNKSGEPAQMAAGTPNRRKRTLESGDKDHRGRESNIRSIPEPDDTKQPPEAPTNRRTRKIDH